MLSVQDLSFGYGRKTVGSHVGFDLHAGEVLCLLGPNGSGKTTLMKTLLGLLPAKGGTLTLDGRPLAAWSDRERAARIAYVPQAANIFFPFTVREVVLMGRAPRIDLFATPSAADRRLADAALDLLGIAHLAERRCDEISGGERQLASIARALAQEPRVLVMDEPTASLDFGNRIKLLERIRGLAATGVATLFSTHAPDEAFFSADRVVLLRRGGLLAVGAPTEVITAANMRTLYDIDVEVAYVDALKQYVCTPSIPSPRTGDRP
jgi:iron complex transport system ATP-binding protein